MPDQNSEYDVIRRATVLADNPNHANTYDVQQMALSILNYERQAQDTVSRKGRAGRMYAKG